MVKTCVMEVLELWVSVLLLFWIFQSSLADVFFWYVT